MAALKALFAQLAAFICVLALVRTGALPPSSMVLAAIQGACAAAVAAVLRSDRWWLALHLMFPIAVVTAAQFGVPAWVYLMVFIGLLLTYWTTFRTRVPLFLSNRATVAAVAGWLPRGRSATVLDVGSGTGAFALQLARLRPDCSVTGLELAPLPALLARMGARGIANAQLLRGDFWKHSLGNYDVVYAFLSPVPMADLWRKACAEMRPGGWFISNSFVVPEVKPDEVLVIDDRRRTQLYCYRIAGADAPPVR